MITLLAGGGYLVYNPSVIPYPEAQKQVIVVREKAIDQTPVVKDAAEKVLGLTAEAAVDLAYDLRLSGENAKPPEEIVVEDMVDNFSQELKNLPQNQVNKIKAQFCQDLIDEATRSAGSGQAGQE